MVTLQEISDLLDEKLKPINQRLETLETNVEKILAFVSVGNEDAVKKLPKLKKVNH